MSREAGDTRAVIYARYSTELQRVASIEDQIRVCRERIDLEGWTYLHAYHDRAMSGTSSLRPGYQKLLDEARKGMFDVVVAEALDRLSRDQEHVAHLYKRLSFLGVKLVTVSEGLISELHIGLSGTMGALYVKQLAEKTHRGLRGRIESGRSGGGISYGYDPVQKPCVDGDPDVGLRAINPREAEHVRWIFEAYSRGASPRSIAKALNAKGVVGPSGGTWGPSTINGNAARGTGILNNELYIGKLLWNRLKYVKNPETGRRQSRLNPREAWVVRDVPELRIVPQALWESAKSRQSKMRRETRPDSKSGGFWTCRRPRYLFSGLLKCGVCGANYTKHGTNRFACAAARDRATCANRLTVRRDAVELAILDGLKTRLMDPDLFKEFAREFLEEMNKSRLAASSARIEIQRNLEKIGSQIERLVDAIVAGADVQAVRIRLAELEAEKSKLHRELEACPAQKPLLHPGLAEIYRARVAGLSKLFNDPEHGSEAFELLRGLIDEIRVIPDGEGFQLELRGELAGILALAHGEKHTAETAGQAALQVKVVAGVGFEPTTFRL